MKRSDDEDLKYFNHTVFKSTCINIHNIKMYIQGHPNSNFWRSQYLGQCNFTLDEEKENTYKSD